MTPYLNLGSDSNVESYKIEESSIHVRFKSGKHRNYLYDSLNPGVVTLKIMKELAIQGCGLNSYISKTVKADFSKKW
jgi:hypothetical protein